MAVVDGWYDESCGSGGEGLVLSGRPFWVVVVLLERDIVQRQWKMIDKKMLKEGGEEGNGAERRVGQQTPPPMTKP